MLVLLIGPKGSGKTHVGRVLERRLGVHFFHVEVHWLAYHQACREAGRRPQIGEGVARIHPLIAQALRQHEHVCVETTGASEQIVSDLIAMAAGGRALKVRLRASMASCLRRIESRDGSQQIPVEPQHIRAIHLISEAGAIEHDLLLDNEGLTDDEIVRAIGPRLAGPAGASADAYR